MKKVAIFSLHLGVGGIEKCVTSLANLLCDYYEVEIISTYKLNKEPAFDIDKRVKVKYLINDKPNRQELKSALTDFKIVEIFKQIFKSIKILYKKYALNVREMKNTDSDIIISTRDYFNKLLGEYGKNKYKIGWEHNYPQNKKEIHKLLKTVKNLDKLVLVSKTQYKLYSQYLKGYKCEPVCIYNFLDEIPTITSNLENLNLISVGRLSKEKGFTDLVKAFSIMYKKNNYLHLDIVGDGDEYQEVSNLINKLNLNKAITMHGYKDKDFINMLYQNSSIYLMTSYTESFGLVLIEAMSFGLPCIAYDDSEGATELIKNDYNGYLIKNRNAEEMSKKVLELIDDKIKIQELSINSVKFVKKYDKNRIVKDWLKLLERK